MMNRTFLTLPMLDSSRALNSGRSPQRPLLALAGHSQTESVALLQIADDAEQIARLRVAARPEHADQALRRGAQRAAQLLEALGCLDVVTQDGLAGVDIAREHRLDRFLDECFAERRIGCDVVVDQLAHTASQGGPDSSFAAHVMPRLRRL